MKLTETLRNIWYAATHANQLIGTINELQQQVYMMDERARIQNKWLIGNRADAYEGPAEAQAWFSHKDVPAHVTYPKIIHQSDGWKWIDYENGTGCLQTPDEEVYCQYDRKSFFHVGGVGFHMEIYEDDSWKVFWGDIEQFKEFVEKGINQVERLEFSEAGQLDGITLQQRIEQYCRQERDIDALDAEEDFGYNHGFYPDEAYEITGGIRCGFSAEQVGLYAKPYFDWHQMLEIQKGFLNGLSLEQVSSYAKAEYSWQEMEEIREGLAYPKSASANGFPKGWQWFHYNDGSGHLESPDGKCYFSYDQQPYSNAGGIEYKATLDGQYTVFWGTMEDFKTYAESVTKNQYLPQQEVPNEQSTEMEMDTPEPVYDYEPEM